MRRKLMIGALALALPAGTMVFTQSSAFAKAPPNPVSCKLSATVTFPLPGISVAGVLSTKGTMADTTITTTYSSCTTASGPVAGMIQSVQIPAMASKPNKDPAALAAGDNPKSYYLGLCGGFGGSSTTKALGKALKNLPVAGGILKGPKATEGPVGGGLGFIITGTVKGGSYPTVGHGETIMSALANTANNANLLAGCTSGNVTHIDIDPTQSTAVL